MSKEGAIVLIVTIVFGFLSLAPSVSSAEFVVTPLTVAFFILAVITAVGGALWVRTLKPAATVASTQSPDIWSELEGRVAALEPDKMQMGHRLGAILDKKFLVLGGTPQRQQEFESHAGVAASALLAFPAIKRRLSAEVLNAPEGYERWLYFLKQQGELKNPGHAFYGDGSKPETGEIANVCGVSVRYFRKCRAWVIEG